MHFVKGFDKNAALWINVQVCHTEFQLFPFQLEELPLSFNKLTSLKSLDLFNNKLTEIPEALNYFTQLVRLDLSEVNHLFEIGNNYFIMNS